MLLDPGLQTSLGSESPEIIHARECHEYVPESKSREFATTSKSSVCVSMSP